MRRRQFVAALPLASGLAGCLGESGPTDSAGTSPDSTETVSTAAGTPETVSATLRSSYRYGINDDAIGVTPPEQAQFAFVRPPDAAEERSPETYALELGSERFVPASSVTGFMSWTPGIDSVYTDDRRSGSLRFDVPTVEAETAALVGEDERWPLEQSAREHLASAPDLRLESMHVPNSVEPTERIELGVTVANGGERTGTFLAGFRRGGYPKTIEVTVDPGDSNSGSVAYDAGDSEGELSFAYSGPGTDDRVSVAVQAETDTPRSTTDR
ncbi:hypothetical protein [Halosimplex sp. J119]